MSGKGRMTDEKFRRKVEGFLWGLFRRQVMYANDPANQDIYVWLGLEEVTSRCAACCVPKKECKAGNGWVDLLEVNDLGEVFAGPDGHPAIKRHFGLVMWYRKDDHENS